MDRLKGKVAIVTGSTSGIGSGIAKMFGAEGARVVVCGRNEERGAAVVDAIAEAGGTAWFHKLDITQPETVDALFADTKEKWGSIDVLVNNAAGMALKDGRVDEISLEDWDAVFAPRSTALRPCCPSCKSRARALSSTSAPWPPAAAIWARRPTPAPRPVSTC